MTTTKSIGIKYITAMLEIALLKLAFLYQEPCACMALYTCVTGHHCTAAEYALKIPYSNVHAGIAQRLC